MLIRPKSVLGEFVDGPRDSYKAPNAAYQEFEKLYTGLATTVRGLIQ